MSSLLKFRFTRPPRHSSPRLSGAFFIISFTSEKSEQAVYLRGLGIQVIIDARALFARLDHTGVFKYLHVVRNRRAGQVHLLGELYHTAAAAVPAEHGAQQLLPRLVADGRQHAAAGLELPLQPHDILRRVLQARTSCPSV